MLDYLTLQRVLAPSTHDTPSKLVSLAGEHFLTFTGTTTLVMVMSHCFIVTVWQCSQSSTYLALHWSWQPLSTEPRRTKMMRTSASDDVAGGGAVFMVLISVWCPLILNLHSVGREGPSCLHALTISGWLRRGGGGGSISSSLLTLLLSQHRASGFRLHPPTSQSFLKLPVSRISLVIPSDVSERIKLSCWKNISNKYLMYQNILIFEK